jgi:branched-chain amino acid transport system permease protein
VADMMQASLSSIAPEIASRTAFLRWTFVGLLLAGIVLYRPEGILKEEKIVSEFVKRFGAGRKKAASTQAK